MNSSFAMILFSVACGVAGQLSLKTGMTQFGRIGADAVKQPLEIALGVASNPFVIAGLSLYAFSAAVWLAVLSRVPLSFAYPVVALTYVLTPILAWLLLGEQLPGVRWLGVGAICLGVVLVSRS